MNPGPETIAVPHDTQLPALPRAAALIRCARERQGITLQSVSEETRIRRGLVEAIENEDYPNLPAPVFTRGLLLQITKLLGISDDIAKDYMIERDAAQTAANDPESSERSS